MLKEIQKNQGFKPFFKYKKSQKSSKHKDYEESKDDMSESKINDEDEDGYEEPLDKRTVQTFLKNLPGVTASDSQGYRIEALRVYLEENLGETSFIAAYKHYINVSDQNDDIEAEIEGIVGPKKRQFMPLIYQLIVCEDTYYNRDL